MLFVGRAMIFHNIRCSYRCIYFGKDDKNHRNRIFFMDMTCLKTNSGRRISNLVSNVRENHDVQISEGGFPTHFVSEKSEYEIFPG